MSYVEDDNFITTDDIEIDPIVDEMEAVSTRDEYGFSQLESNQLGVVLIDHFLKYKQMLVYDEEKIVFFVIALI